MMAFHPPPLTFCRKVVPVSGAPSWPWSWIAATTALMSISMNHATSASVPSPSISWPRNFSIAGRRGQQLRGVATHPAGADTAQKLPKTREGTKRLVSY